MHGKREDFRFLCQLCNRLHRFRFGSAYFIYDMFSMYKVYNAKLLDQLKMKVFEWSEPESFYSMIPTLESGELSFFTPLTIKDQKIFSFWQHIKISKLMVFHHMFIGSYGLIVLSSWRGGLGDCVFSFMFMMEVSTPFVSFRSILSILNLKKTKLFMINGLVMLITFTIFRILMLPALLYYYSTVVNLSFVRAIIKLPLGCQLSIIALFLPQFYWFNLMIRVALRVSWPHWSPLMLVVPFNILTFFRCSTRQSRRRNCRKSITMTRKKNRTRLTV